MTNFKPIFLIEKTRRIKRTIWTQEEDNKLIALADIQMRRSWTKLAKDLNKTPYQCLLRYRSINPNLRKGAWSSKEDHIILDNMRIYGKKWNLIALKFTNRNAKQIRDRYTNYLDPKITRNNFTLDEDLLILDLYSKHGSRWTYIKNFIPHRSSDMIKNRYKSSICRNEKLYIMLKSLKVSLLKI
jgi:hypothetical protein